VKANGYTFKEIRTIRRVIIFSNKLIKWTAKNSGEQSHITIPELVKKLAVSPEKRTNIDRKLIADALYVFISSIAPFKEGFMKSDAIAVAKRAELQTVDAKQTVFRQGEAGSEFYFVLQGSVAIQVGTKIVKVLGDKVAFGELALQCKCKRSASVLGAEDATHLLVVSKKLYQRHFAATHRKQMASKMKFIEKLNAGQLTPDEMAILCSRIKMRTVSKNQKICSTTGPAQNLYYLIEGRAEEHGYNNAKVVRKLLRDPTKHETEGAIVKVCKSLHMPEGKTKEVKEMLKGIIYDNMSMATHAPTHRLASLLAGQIFGEPSWLYGAQAMTTVVARSDCKLWVLPFTCVHKLVAEYETVRHRLHKMARKKLQFRLARFDTLNRARKVTTPRISTSTPSARNVSTRKQVLTARCNVFSWSSSIRWMASIKIVACSTSWRMASTLL